MHHPKTFKRGIPFITHKATHNITVFLFHMTAIIRLVGTRSGKGKLVIATLLVEALIDEFTTVV